jgi:uncharacterized SAM-binding protein YcdF (DUF218 family)
MFFYASKIFWALAQPLSLIFLLVGLGLLFLILQRRRLAIAAQSLAALLLFLVAFTTLGSVMIQPLENRFPRSEAPAEISAIIVLGGATSSRVGGARGITELNGAGDRMTEALVLALRYPQAPLVFTGGFGTIIAEGETEAASAERFFIAQGVDPKRLVLEDQARNTDENARLTAELIEGGEAPALLVTSAFHMPRSVGLFRQAGVEVVPWPVDYRSTGTERLGIDIANPVLNIEITGIALREWIGLMAYHWTGRTGEIVPGP